MLVESVIITLIVGGTCWLLFTKRKRRWNPTEREAGEQWKVIEFRRNRWGFVYLSQSENDGHWIVHEVPSGDTTVTSKMARYRTEKQARAAYARVGRR
jgi:hypothetical protein